MNEGIAMLVGKWLLALLPIIVLLFTILVLKWDAPKSGAFAWFTSMLIGSVAFGADSRLLALANSKGMSLSAYVLLIVWSAVYLYNVVEKVGAVKVIGDNMISLTKDRALQVLIMAWCFSSFMQGIAGFGVPIAVVAPIMVVMGFQPIVAVATCLVGYCWSISFGSMGSSFYTIQLVTSIPAVTIGTWMSIIFIVPVFLSGLGTLFIFGGKSAVKHGAPAVLVTGTVICFTMWLMNVLDAGQLATMIPALLGCCTLAIMARTRLYRENSQNEAFVAAATETPSGTATKKMGFHLAFSPYYILIALSLIAQIKGLSHLLSPLSWGLDYPAEQTIFGYMVKPEHMYARISIFNHPGPLMIIAALGGILVFKRAGYWRTGILAEAAAKTIKQCITTSVGIITMVMMAISMNDAGITTLLANGMAGTTGKLFPVLSPYIGVLGAFLTGSNTNANVMFGALQAETAKVLGVSSVIIAAVQSVGAAVGCSIAPTTVMLGSTTVGMSGRESEVMSRTVPYCIGISLMVGIYAWIFSYVIF